MERTTLEIIAPSVEEALAQGLPQLGLAQDQVEVEIIDEGNRGFLGFGTRQMRIRLSPKIYPEAQSLPELEDQPATTDSCSTSAFRRRVN